MAPKREKNKEKLRESRRQGDPFFPSSGGGGGGGSSSSSQQQASRIPRPSILLSGRQNAPQQENRAAKITVSKEPQATTAAKSSSKAQSSKGLRVTFDLSRNGKDEVPEVVESWEDLSDDLGNQSDDGEYEITEADIIDCEREFGDLGDEFIDFGHGNSSFSTRGIPMVDSAGFPLGPRQVPGLNDIEDFSAIGDDEDDGNYSDYDNVETSRNNKNNLEQNIRYFSDDNSDDKIAQSHEETCVVPDGSTNTTVSDPLVKRDDLSKTTESTETVTADSCATGHRADVILPGDKTSICNSKIMPFIDGTEEVGKGVDVAAGVVPADGGDDDDEWETEPSGGSDESGKIYKIDNNYTKKENDAPSQKLNKSQTIHHLNPVYFDDDDEGTMADQPSIGEEDDSDIITNADLDAAFHSVMKEEEEYVPENMLEGKFQDERPIDGWTSVTCNNEPLTTEEKPESNWVGRPSGEGPELIQEGLAERKPELTQEGLAAGKPALMQEDVKVELAAVDVANTSGMAYPGILGESSKQQEGMPEEKPELMEGSISEGSPVSNGKENLLEDSGEIQQSVSKPSVSEELEPQERPETFIGPLAKDSGEIQQSVSKPTVSEELEPQERPETFIGPLAKLESAGQSQLIETGDVTTQNDRSESPKVSIGFECHKGKPKSSYASEAESSEGELVIGEDKCVGTADHYVASDDNEPLDLSTSERTSSKGENDMSESLVDTVSFISDDEGQGDQLNLAQDDDKHKVSANLGTGHLAVPTASRTDASPSPEIPSSTPIGNSESCKEKDKISDKKGTKKKGRKNKRDGKLELGTKAEVQADRPKLVRGKTWKEKREKFKNDHGDALPLSFGKEVCESEIVEGTSNLLTETYTEASLLTASRCSTETTIVTEMPCTACSSRTEEFNDSESLCKDCSCLHGEKKRSADAIAQVTEMKACDESLCHTPTVTQASNANAFVTSGLGNGLPDGQTIQSPAEKDDFYIVKACEVAVPLEVLTEYVPDSESSEETNGLLLSGQCNRKETNDDSKLKSSIESRDKSRNGVPDHLKQGDEPELYVDSSSSFSSDEQNPVYFDAKDSSCLDKVKGSYDYNESFPPVIGTHNLSYVYSYDDDLEFQRRTDRPKLTVKPLKATLGSSGVMVANLGEDDDDDSDTPLNPGDIIYEGPCTCGPGEGAGNHRKHIRHEGFSSEDDMLCVPPLFSSNSEGPLLGEGVVIMGVETDKCDTCENMGSNGEDPLGNYEGDPKDIKSRIKEIVGPRLHHKRGRQTARRRGGGGGGGSSGGGGVTSEDQGQNDDFEGKTGRDESPMPGSSPASSSGVQGSDEMSPSRSRSRSLSREESVSPPSTTDNVPDIVFEAYQVQEVSPSKVERDSAENVWVSKHEGNVDSSSEKANPVDYSFKTFRDMYQINPVYTTDSDDHDDLNNESDTVVQGSPSLSYDPDRSITVSSIVQRWEVLQAQAVERQRQSGQVRELQRQVKTMRLTLENLADQANEAPQSDAIETHQQLAHKLQEAKALLEEVRARKADVSSLNLQVHRFFTDSGYSLAQLKDEVSDLYILYDEAHRRATSEVSRFEELEATWKLWEAEAEELSRALRQDGDTLKVLDVAIQTGSLTDSVTASVQDVARLLNDRRKSQPGKKLLLQHTRTQGVDIQGSTLSLGTSGDDCLSDSGTSGYESCSSEELSERERRLAHLRRLARDLEASLSPDSKAWAAITKTLSSAEMELKDLQKHCRELVVRSTETLDQTKTSPQLRKRSWAKDSKVGRMGRSDRRVSGRDSGRGNGRRGWMWRVVRAALPIQAALLLLFCVACLLEPNCCDTHNSLTMTLTPQLRYVHGPPPV